MVVDDVDLCGICSASCSGAENVMQQCAGIRIALRRDSI